MLDLGLGGSDHAHHAIHGLLLAADTYIFMPAAEGQRYHRHENQDSDKKHGLKPRYSRFFS